MTNRSNAQVLLIPLQIPEISPLFHYGIEGSRRTTGEHELSPVGPASRASQWHSAKEHRLAGGAP